MTKEISVLKQSELLGHQLTVFGTPENPLFLAREVAEMIDYRVSNASEMLNLVDDDEKVKIFCTLDYQGVSNHLNLMKPCKSSSYNEAESIAEFVNDKAGGELLPTTKTTGGANRWFLTEDGVYEVLMQSRTEEAKAFKKGVKKILHEIRTTGGYIATKTSDSPEEIMARALIVAQNTLKRLEVENTQQKQAISELQISNNELTADNNALKEGNKNLTDTNIVLAEHNAKQKEQIQSQQETITKAQPKVEYYDMAMSSNTQYTTNEIALELHTTAVMLNRRLNADGIQYKQGDCWLLSAKYRDCGYTEIRTYEVYGNDGQVIKRKPMMRWTEKGRQFLLQKYGRHENNM